jgi:penicillin-binding protein 1C
MTPRDKRAARGVGPKLWRSRKIHVALGALLLAAGSFWALLPRPLFVAPESAVLLARDGSLLGARIASDGQWRFPQLQQVPPRFAQALILYEDQRFRGHPGIDPLAIGRAVRSNWRARRVVSGASTLTQQLARLVRQRDGARPRRSYLGKTIEALLAVRLEFEYSKDEVLALYASHAPFGGNVVGLEAAAWRYFARSPGELSWAEAATLAVLPNAPGLVTPGKQRTRLLQRRDALLKRIAQRGVLTDLDLQLALLEPLVDQPRPLPDVAPHLLDTLRKRYPGQQRFVSSIEPALQRQAVELVREHSGQLLRAGIGNAAALIIDNRSFEVLAYVGNADWRVSGERALAVDIVQRPRSTGSILKPFLYAAMLDSSQLLPRMLVADVPMQFQGFTPENFDRAYRGAVPADVALAQSLNVPAVRLLREYGYPRFHELLQSLGFKTLNRPPDHYGLSMILGGAEATLWDVGMAYANLADRARGDTTGSSMAQRRELVWQRSAPTAAAPSSPARAMPISVGAAWLTQEALLNVVRPEDERHWRSFANQRQIAWKTGTSWGLRDAWAVGSSAAHTVAVWAGNADGTGVPGLTGSGAAAPLLFALHNRLPRSNWYAEPARDLKTVQVCADDGFLATDLCAPRAQRIPVRSHFDRQSPHHVLVHLDGSGEHRVTADCERVSAMRHQGWFTLPPTMEHYYRREHSNYRPLPPLRRGCGTDATLPARLIPMEFLYPGDGGRIYLPIELDGSKGRVVFEVAHRQSDKTLHWHLDDRFAGSTRYLHQLVVDLDPGDHQVTVVDADGNRLTRRFAVIARGHGYTGATMQPARP